MAFGGAGWIAAPATCIEVSIQVPDNSPDVRAGLEDPAADDGPSGDPAGVLQAAEPATSARVQRRARRREVMCCMS